MSPKRIPYKKYLKPYARKLRTHGTPDAAYIWYYLVINKNRVIKMVVRGDTHHGLRTRHCDEGRRSNLGFNNEIAAFRCTPLAMTVILAHWYWKSMVPLTTTNRKQIESEMLV